MSTHSSPREAYEAADSLLNAARLIFRSAGAETPIAPCDALPAARAAVASALAAVLLRYDVHAAPAEDLDTLLDLVARFEPLLARQVRDVAALDGSTDDIPLHMEDWEVVAVLGRVEEAVELIGRYVEARPVAAPSDAVP